MFGWEFPPHNSGGLGTACYGLTKALTKKRADIIFVLPKKLEGVDESFLRITSPELPYKRTYTFDSPLGPYLTPKGYKCSSDIFQEWGRFYGSDLFEEVFRYAAFGKFVAEKEDFDVIHAHDWLSFGAGVSAKRKTGKPLVAHVHATEFDRGGGNSIDERVYRIEKKGMEEADKVVAVSEFTKNIIVNNYGIPREKVEVVYNGVEASPGEDSSIDVHKLKEAGKKIVLFVGRLTLQKGPDHLISCAKRVCDHSDDIFFVISGSGDMEKKLMEKVAAMGISDRVIFTGFLRGEKLKRMYKMADLFVMPSVSEPFGITPLESLINGTPVLVSRQSGVSEVVTHALKVDFWDTEEMANKIISALSYESLCSCLRENGKKEVGKITWDKAAEKCLKIYEKI